MCALGATQDSVILAGKGEGVDLGRNTITDPSQPKFAPPVQLVPDFWEKLTQTFSVF